MKRGFLIALIIETKSVLPQFSSLQSSWFVRQLGLFTLPSIFQIQKRLLLHVFLPLMEDKVVVLEGSQAPRAEIRASITPDGTESSMPCAAALRPKLIHNGLFTLGL